MAKKFGGWQDSLKQENNKLIKVIVDLKGVLEYHKSITDKAVNAVQSKCDKFTKEVSETHDKTVKEAVEKAISEVMKNNVKSDVPVNQTETAQKLSRPKLSKVKIKELKERSEG